MWHCFGNLLLTDRLFKILGDCLVIVSGSVC
jgi:hypothetical protein